MILIFKRVRMITKNRSLLFIASTALLSTALTGCIPSATKPQPQMTEAQRAQVMQAREAYMERMRAALSGQSSLQAKPAVQELESVELAKVTETELAEQIAKLNQSSQSSVQIERVRDGLKINGMPYLDPEGSILDFAGDPLTGNLVYVIKIDNATRVYKYMNAGSNEMPVTLGKVTASRNSVSFVSASGQKMNGDNVLPTSKGALVIRDASAFHYVPGKRVTSLMLPDNYHVAPIQNGDLGSTNYLLLEKNPVDKKAQPFGSLLSSLTAIGNTLGATEVDDYVLYNIETNNLVTLDVSAEGKSVAHYSKCKKLNLVVNECSSVNFYNSLYKEDGFRNTSHYFWKISWFNTEQGAFAVVGEKGLAQINLINLNERKKTTLFERALGINGFDTEQTADGKIAIQARMGFSVEKIDDAVQVYSHSNPVVMANK